MNGEVGNRGPTGIPFRLPHRSPGARRFRRRPGATVCFCLALAAVILLRYAYDRLVDRPSLAAASYLREGGCDLVRVIDADTIVVRQQVTHPNQAKRSTCEATICLLAIDSPERDEPLGEEAAELTRRMLAGGAATLRFDRRRLDREGGFLAYVFVDDQLVNAALVRAGLARVDSRPGDSPSLARVLRLAEAEAQAQRRGLWSLSRPRP